MIPGTAADPWSGRVGKSLALPYGIYGRLPTRSGTDMLRSVKKHLAEVLTERASEFLTGIDPDTGGTVVRDAWEVRLNDERGAFRLPFASVQAVGPELSVGPVAYADITQPVNLHLYPFPSQTSEEALLVLGRVGTTVHDALKWGAARGRPLCIPIWDYGAATGLYQDSEARLSNDYVRVLDLQTDRILDPGDERRGFATVNFRARWRRVPTDVPGHLVESVRVTVHPE